MRALICHALREDYSGLSHVSFSRAPLSAGEVRVRLRAASLNFPDLLMIQGKYQLKPGLPFTPGMEAAGEVIEIGPGVVGFEAGDAVIVTSRFGMLAEEVTVRADALRSVPAGMSWAAAASYAVVWTTAYVALLRFAFLQRSEVLLVHGAAGGVGMAAVDLGLLLGATVIATASSPEKRDVLMGRGAHHVFGHSHFREEVKRLTADRGADVIFDPVGGDVFDDSTRCIAFGGRLLTIGFASGRIPTISAHIPLIKVFSLMGVRAGEYGRRYPERQKEDMAAIQRLAEAGSIRPHISMTAPFSEVVSVFEAMAQRRVVGKAVVVFDSSV